MRVSNSGPTPADTKNLRIMTQFTKTLVIISANEEAD
jgi:hypothetical protein